MGVIQDPFISEPWRPGPTPTTWPSAVKGQAQSLGSHGPESLSGVLVFLLSKPQASALTSQRLSAAMFWDRPEKQKQEEMRF